MNTGPGQSLSDRMVESWNRFWFTPRDPTVLGLIRLFCGLITLYTVLAYSLDLQNFFGKRAWWDLTSALKTAREKPIAIDLLRGGEIPPVPSEKQKPYFDRYFDKYGTYPPYPYASSQDEDALVYALIGEFDVDFRMNHLPFPQTPEQEKYLREYLHRWKQPPPPPYPATAKEAEQIEDYIAWHGVDPRAPYVYARGRPVWSLWFHVTDPGAMALVHIGIIVVTFLFAIGFCTRITSVLTWVGQLSYIHRTSMVLFGVDTMMTILLVYLMIGSSGGAWSVDRLIARWWSRAKPRVINRWRSFWGLAAVAVEPAPAASLYPTATVSTNVAMRMLQIHLCIIYLAAGLSKLLGQAWWNGTAVWGTIANFEFAPMQFEIYNHFLRFLGRNKMVFMGFLTVAGYFTLVFEIGFTFLIWRPATRWVMLGMAIILHGFIGLFMGLKTFSLMMLVMNMAFLRPEEARWLMGGFWRRGQSARIQTAAEPTPARAKNAVGLT